MNEPELNRIRKTQVAARFAAVGVCETGGGTSWPDYYERDVHELLQHIDEQRAANSEVYDALRAVETFIVVSVDLGYIRLSDQSIPDSAVATLKLVRRALAKTKRWLSMDIDWRQRLRDFAEDSEQHQISRKTWKQLRGDGVTLYSDGDYFTAYYDDAAILWDQADDELPMFHVQVQSDPPHRCCIHALHLAAWVQHLIGMAVPVLIVDRPEMEE